MLFRSTLGAGYGGTGLATYTAGDLLYASGSTTISKLGIGTTNYVLTSSGTAPQYVAQSTLTVGNATNAVNVGITDDTSTNATMYPTWVTANTGNLPEKVSSTKLTFNPSLGTFTSPQVSASNGIVVNSKTVATSYSIPSGSNAMSAGPVTVNSGVTVTIPSGSRWVVL